MRKLLGLAVLGLAFTGTAFADAVDDIETAIATKWEKASAFSYDMEMSNKVASDDFEMSSKTTGMSEMQRRDGKDGKWNLHMESTTDSVQKMGGKETKTTSKTSMVSDGTVIYLLTESGGQKSAMKTKATGGEAGGKEAFKAPREGNDCKLLPEEAVSGMLCYVIETVPKKVESGTSKMTTKYYFAKDSGFMVEMNSKSDDGKTSAQMSLKNVKIDPSIPADHFVFKAPAGVEVQDMTDMEARIKKMQEDAAKAAADADAKSKEEPAKAEATEEAKPAEKKEEPKKEEPKKKSKLKGFGL